MMLAMGAEAKDFGFAYVYPAAARAIPKLRALLDAEAAAEKREFTADRAEARKDLGPGETAPDLSWSREWQVVTDTPRFLSLSQTTSDYSGGAHGNYDFGSLVWDKAAGMRREPMSFFASRTALLAAIRSPFCAGLKTQREDRRGVTPNDVEPSVIPEFDKCIDPTQNAVLLLGSSDRRRFDRLGFQMAPYVAGPYSDGSYEVTLPVTPAVLAAVRPEFRGYFATGEP